MTDIQEIRAAASEFRKAIEACAPSLGISFQFFPSGSCGDVTPLLGTYLLELGLGRFKYMLGMYCNSRDNSWGSHAWLQAENLVIDITADQFPDFSEKVFVQENSVWHNNLDVKCLGWGDYRVYDARTVEHLSILYAKIVRVINLDQKAN